MGPVPCILNPGGWAGGWRSRHFGSFVRLATAGESRHGLRYPGFLTILHVGLQQTAHLVEKGNVGKVFAVTRSAIRF